MPPGDRGYPPIHHHEYHRDEEPHVESKVGLDVVGSDVGTEVGGVGMLVGIEVGTDVTG